MIRRNSMGFEFPSSTEGGTASLSSVPGGSDSCSYLSSGGLEDVDQTADNDSAFVDDDLESSWDQLRMRQFKEQLSVVEEAPARGGVSSLFVRLFKKLMTVRLLLFATARLDKYEKIILILTILLVADSLALAYLLVSYPVYRDTLGRLGMGILFNTTGFFKRASAVGEL